MRSSIAKTFAVIALTAALDMAALGHTTVGNVTPKSGSTLQASPANIELEFRSQATLTSVVAVRADKSERRLQFKPGARPGVFIVLEPKLEPGRNQIKWKGLSQDGHVISGSLIYTIQAPGAK